MNKQRSFSSVVSMLAAAIGVAAFAPAAMADENHGRHVKRLLDSMVLEGADAPYEAESPLPTRLASKRRFDAEPGTSFVKTEASYDRPRLGGSSRNGTTFEPSPSSTRDAWTERNISSSPTDRSWRSRRLRIR